MKIVILSHSDHRGGAAIASYRLMEQLRNQGHSVTMLVMEKLTDDADVQLAGTWLSRRWAFLSERLGIFMHNGFSRRRLFKVSTATKGVVKATDKAIVEADLIVVGWINQGLLSLRELNRIASLPGKRVEVVMHDLWWMTGVCHHPFDCKRYELKCGQCPLLDSHKSGDISAREWSRKHVLYTANPTLKFVAVSRWVANCAKRSSLLSDTKVAVRYNPVDIDSFVTAPERPLDELAPYEGYRTITFGAARLDDPTKGIDKAIDALNLLADKGLDRVVALFYGAKRDKKLLERLRIPYVDFGMINDAAMLRRIMASTDIIFSASDRETFGLTLLEGIASGAVAVTFGGDGREDVVSHLKNGYIAPSGNVEMLSRGLIWALDKINGADCSTIRATQRQSVMHFASK